MNIPDVAAGDPLSASEHNANVRAPLRAMQLTGGVGIRVSHLPNGTVLHTTTVASGGGSSSYTVQMEEHGHRSLTDGGPLCTYSAVVGGVD